MVKKTTFFLCILFCMLTQRAFSQSAETDSVDVLHYSMAINFQPDSARKFCAQAQITFVHTRPCSEITFDLICDSIATTSPLSIKLDNQSVASYYVREDAKLHIPMSPTSIPDTHVLQVYYYTNGHVESYNWGGLHITSDLCYNLGVAFQDYPHNYGRAWFPCRDNFYDKATYHITITSPTRFSHQCSGIKSTDTTISGQHFTEWTLSHLTPTYLVSISMAPWHIIEREYTGLYGTYPATLGYTSHDSANVYNAYSILEDVIPMYERCFGPYRWNRIGYIATPQGSMEHVNNIGLVSTCTDNTSSNSCQMTICHELSHAWFGNLVTCATAEDMWFNEGGASFCEEVATEAAFGKEAANDYYQDKLSKVLRTAHIDDEGYRSLSGMSQYYTYGTTTYQQGAMMWHSLRGYLGDSLFYASMQRLFSSCAFGNVSAQSLRDSLSLYSGINLHGFFDANVFTPGFIDYSIDRLVIDGSQATLTLRQLLLGRTQYAYGNRVPVSFFTADGQRSDQLMTFDDSIATTTFQLPFTPAYCIVDYHHALSDAATSDTTTLHAKGLRNLSHSFCKVNVGTANSDPHAWVHISHHYAHPTGDTLDGVVRMANRYWQVTGFVPWDGDVTGRFLYNQGANGSAGASCLDLGFYDRSATLDSMVLLYRADATQPWQMVSHTRTSSSTMSSGYFTARLFPGQYSLAVADTSQLSISSPHQDASQPTLKVYPNPNSSNTIHIDLGSYNKKFNLFICDSLGRKVLKKKNISSPYSFRHHLTPGTYFVLIQNNSVSLQSQIIIQ